MYELYCVNLRNEPCWESPWLTSEKSQAADRQDPREGQCPDRIGVEGSGDPGDRSGPRTRAGFSLAAEGTGTIKAVVESVGRVKSTVTVTIRTLEKYGYLCKFPSDTDRRVMYVELTAKGRQTPEGF